MKDKILFKSENNNKVAIVTGGAKGIGQGIALALAKDGFDIMLHYRTSHNEAQNTVEEINKNGVRALAFSADLTKRGDVENLMDETLNKFGRIDVLVNNAGILEQKPFDEITDSDWDSTINTNLTSVFLTTQICVKVIRSGGSIVNISSIGGQIGGAKAPHYAASKGAIITFTKSMARIYANRNIRVNAVSPGFISTDMLDHILKRQNKSTEEVSKDIPLNRIGLPSEIGDAVAYLVSSRASYVTGQILNVNGGLFL